MRTMRTLKNLATNDTNDNHSLVLSRRDVTFLFRYTIRFLSLGMEQIEG